MKSRAFFYFRSPAYAGMGGYVERGDTLGMEIRQGPSGSSSATLSSTFSIIACKAEF